MAWIAAGAALVGGYMSSRSSAKAQAGANANDVAIHNNQMAWQNYWRNTEVQARVNDLKAAGLNPMLAYSGAASTPSAPGMQTRPVEDRGSAIGKGVSNAAQAYLAMKQMQSTTNLQNATARKTDAEASIVEANVPYSAMNAKWSSEMLRESFDKLAHEVHNLELEEKKRNFDIEEYQPLVAEYQKLLNQAERLGMSEKSATSQFFEKVPEGKWAQIVKQLLFGSGSVLRK